MHVSKQHPMETAPSYLKYGKLTRLSKSLEQFGSLISLLPSLSYMKSSWKQMSMIKQVKQVTQSAKLGLCFSKREQFLKQESFLGAVAVSSNKI